MESKQFGAKLKGPEGKTKKNDSLQEMTPDPWSSLQVSDRTQTSGQTSGKIDITHNSWDFSGYSQTPPANTTSISGFNNSSSTLFAGGDPFADI